MANPSLQSPNVGNYFVGKGRVQFKPEGSSNWRYMGNCPSFEFEATLETLDHFSSMEGVKSKDETIILSKGGTLTMQLEELTPANLAIFLLADPDLSDPLNPEIEIFAENLKSGAVRFIGTNDVGPRYTFEFNKVDFVPSGSFNLISDEFGVLELQGNIASSGGSFGTAKQTNLYLTGYDPVNLGLPEVVGNFVVGEELTADEGVWSAPSDGGTVTYTYQWYDDGVAIGGATSRTYVLAVGQVGGAITVQVTATNDNGSTNAVSPAQVDANGDPLVVLAVPTT